MSKVLAILHDIRPEFDFAASSDFFEDAALDSFDLVTLVSALDQAFDVSIDGMEIVPSNFANVETIEALLVRSGAKL